jgi:hypothetical protein
MQKQAKPKMLHQRKRDSIGYEIYWRLHSPSAEAGLRSRVRKHPGLLMLTPPECAIPQSPWISGKLYLNFHSTKKVDKIINNAQ